MKFCGPGHADLTNRAAQQAPDAYFYLPGAAGHWILDE